MTQTKDAKLMQSPLCTDIKSDSGSARPMGLNRKALQYTKKRCTESFDPFNLSAVQGGSAHQPQRAASRAHQAGGTNGRLDGGDAPSTQHA